MDAVKFFKNLYRICMTCSSCGECPLNKRVNKDSPFCPFDISTDKGDAFEQTQNEEIVTKLVNIVEKWTEKYFVKTRKSEFLKLFPNAPIDLCPRIVDMDFECPEALGKVKKETCDECRKKFWLTEVE